MPRRQRTLHSEQEHRICYLFEVKSWGKAFPAKIWDISRPGPSEGHRKSLGDEVREPLGVAGVDLGDFGDCVDGVDCGD